LKSQKMNSRPRRCILLVDDDASARELLRNVLEPEGYLLIEAVDGQEALQMIEKHPVDLLITDRSMPGMGGLDLLRALKEAKKNIPSLMISAYGEEKMWGDAIGLGARDYLLKPFKTDDVLNLVKKILAGEQA